MSNVNMYTVGFSCIWRSHFQYRFHTCVL